jgi:cytochrome c peroxidase
MKKFIFRSAGMLVGVLAGLSVVQASENDYVIAPGHESLQIWLLPDAVPYPDNNEPTAARVELGKKLFFDPRLSGDGDMSCATCHNPSHGWSDGLPTAKGFRGMVLARATPTIVNTAYNSIQMWDGRKATLEDQAMGPMQADVEMNTDVAGLMKLLNTNEDYRQLFARAYPGEPIDESSLSRAIASYERTVVSNNSPFDRWVNGDRNAMTDQQVRGFDLFVGKANCAACHAAPNFTDDGFHNLGLASFAAESPDVGRFAQRPLRLMKGAFKTPTLRDIEFTAPYFHDGSAQTLLDVVEHYAKGGEVKTNLSPNMQPLNLSPQEKQDLVAFMQALSSPPQGVSLPQLSKK